MKCAAACLLVLFSFSFAQTLFAQNGPAPLIADPPSRASISLDGMWNTIIDPYESGISSHFYENRKPASKTDLVEYNFERSPKLKVPGDWNSQREDLLWYEGPMWYQRSFSYQKKANKRVFLYFGAVNYLSRVWLNGTKLGEHVGGYTPFNFEVTDQIKDEDNSVVVEVDNTRRLEGVPSIHTDWWNYGGITRSVKLIEVPETFIQNYSVHLTKESTDEILVEVTLNIREHLINKPLVTVEIPELHLKQSLGEQDRVGTMSQRLQATPDLWSPEKPKLYGVMISAGDDRVVDYIGFRTIETRGTQVLLNGKPVFLRGISAHEEAPYRGGRAVSVDDDRTLITWAKELGCNFMRLTHYPHNEDMIRLADQLGMLIWDETPVYWEIQFLNPAVLDNAKAQLRDVIARDQNRAAVIIWSIANETPINPERNTFLKSMADYARSLDSTRLIGAASDKATHIDAQHMALNDPLGEYLDVIGLNEYIGWYFGKKEDADQIQWSFKYQKPVIITEFGGGAQYGLHGDSDTRFTEEYQADLYRHQLTMLNKIPALAGMSPWVLMDFRSPRRTLAGIQDYYNRKGLFSDGGQRKQAFYVLQKFYEEKAKQ
ncbi:MAG TPA: glycoside hydrolase family 2 TIM barrel-domain containing protein [Terriglobales bacterium]|jgi:beta-glucuronidase|nr:glycoside hydrolase family 2 TIM barrel-domain containing protein [Terriglobales bacterium]